MTFSPIAHLLGLLYFGTYVYDNQEINRLSFSVSRNENSRPSFDNNHSSYCVVFSSLNANKIDSILCAVTPRLFSKKPVENQMTMAIAFSWRCATAFCTCLSQVVYFQFIFVIYPLPTKRNTFGVLRTC